MSADLEKIKIVLDKYNPKQAILYGSRATGYFKPNSDYDIMVFFKSSTFPFKETEQERYLRFYTISCELKKVLGKPVDLVVMKCQNKWVNNIFEQNIEIFFCSL